MLLNQHIKEYDPGIKLSFVKKWKEYGDVYSFVFKPEGEVEFLAGQNARIVVPRLPEEVAARSLSMASTPAGDELLFAMHTGSGSPYKKAMFALSGGDSVELIKVKGETFLPQDAERPAVLIAGGIGVTPFRSIMFDVHERDLGTKLTLVHVARDAHLYEKELTELSFPQHRIQRGGIENTLEKVVAENTEALFFIAGPPPFIAHVQKTLLELGVSEFSLRASKFTGYEKLFE